jgi:predicted nucleic-acid-binding protein
LLRNNEIQILVTFFAFFYIDFGCFFARKKVLEVEIKGAKKTKISFLRNILSTKINTILEKDIIQLKRLPAISHAYYQISYNYDNFYNVLLIVEENLTITPNINFGTTTNKQFAYKLGLYDYNFLGRNIAFGGFYQNNRFDS